MLTIRAVDRHPNIRVFLEALFHGRSKRTFERIEHHIARDVFLARQRVHQQKNFATHRFLPLKSRTGSSFARSTSENANVT